MNQDTACKQLLMGVVVQALQDIDNKDFDPIEQIDWFLSPAAAGVLGAIGFSSTQVFWFRLRLLLGMVDRSRFSAPKLNAARYGYGDKALLSAAESSWATWPVQGAAPLRHA